nr:MAG TPA: hypothetical protein [Caudoviricetes sp.]
MATIYAYSSNSIYCTYSLSISRNGNNVTVTASGTIYGNGSSADNVNDLYAHFRYGVSPENTNSPTTYVSSYGNQIGSGVKIVSRPLNSSSIPTSGKSFTASWNVISNDAITYNNCALFFSKSSTDCSEATNIPAYAFIGKKSSSLSANKLRYYTQNLSIGAGYTACTAPTLIIAKDKNGNNVSILPQNEKVVISWSGAKAGNNNAITKYRVFWKNGSAPTINSYTNYEDVTTTNIEITLSGARGNNYYFKVQTIGTISGYNSEISSTYTTCKINQLPPAPSVIPSATIVPSSGGNISFSLNAIDPDGQIINFYYATTNDTTTEKILIQNGGSIEVKNSQTYYFYSYDGLEYSSTFTEQTIVLNEKPTISIGVAGSGTKYTSELLENTDYTNFYTKILGTATLNKVVGNVYWYCRYATIPTINETPVWTKVDLGINNSPYEFDLTLNNTLNKLSNIIYQVGALYNDGIEETDIIWDNTNFVIAPLPVIGDFINQHGKTNIEYSIPNYFYQNASIIGTKDSSVTSIIVNINNNATVSNVSTVSNYEEDGYFKINITGTIPNTEYELTFTINRVIGSIEKKFIITSIGLPLKDVGAVKQPLSSSDISSQSEILKPHTDSGTFYITLYNFFGTTIYNSVNTNYDGTENPSNCISFCLVKGAKELSITTNYSDISSNADLRFTCNKNFYEIANNVLELDLETINTVDLKVIFKDVFGQLHYITKTNYLTLDFREPFSNNSSLSLLLNSNPISTLSKIQEKDEIGIKFNWYAYNIQIATIQTYIYRSNTNIAPELDSTAWEKYQNNSNYQWTIDLGTETSGASADRSRYGSKTYTYTVGELNKSSYVFFKIETDINGQKKTFPSNKNELIGYTTQRHVSIPDLKVASFSYDAKIKEIKYIHESYDSGGGNTPGDVTDTSNGITKLEVGLQYSTDFSSETNIKYIDTTGEETNDFVSLFTYTDSTNIKEEQISTAEHILSFTKESWSYYNFRLVVKTTIGSVVKTSYSKEFTIYNLTPTVSYRKNQIGINTKPEDVTVGADGVIYIQATTDKKQIYIISANHTIKISLEDGSIDGANIDCGTW